MKIGEMIRKYGEAEVKVQTLAQCTSKMNYTEKKGTAVTFLTDQITPEELLGQQEQKMVGFVVWFERKKFNEILDNV